MRVSVDGPQSPTTASKADELSMICHANVSTGAVQVMDLGLDVTGEFRMVVTAGTNRELSE